MLLRGRTLTGPAGATSVSAIRRLAPLGECPTDAHRDYLREQQQGCGLGDDRENGPGAVAGFGEPERAPALADEQRDDRRGRDRDGRERIVG
jgi:hypothetical protein